MEGFNHANAKLLSFLFDTEFLRPDVAIHLLKRKCSNENSISDAGPGACPRRPSRGRGPSAQHPTSGAARPMSRSRGPLRPLGRSGEAAAAAAPGRDTPAQGDPSLSVLIIDNERGPLLLTNLAQTKLLLIPH